MVAYLLFCILCVLLAFFIGGWALALWGVGTAMVVLADLVQLGWQGFDALANWLARRHDDDDDA